MINKIIAVGIFILLVSVTILCGVAWSAEIPHPPVAEVTDGTKTVYKILYVYNSEIVTNADHSVTWVKYAAETNRVAAYPKMLTIRLKSTDDLRNDYEFTGHEFLVKLGTNCSGFYTAELVIE